MNHAQNHLCTSFGLIITEKKDDRWLIVEMNDIGLQNCGYTRQELIGQDIKQVTDAPDEDEAAVIQAYQSLENGQPAAFTSRQRHKNGTFFATRTLASGEYDQKGQLIRCHFASILIDNDAPDLFRFGQREMMQRTERMTAIGSWFYSLKRKSLTVSDNVYSLFSVPKEKQNPDDFKKVFPETIIKTYSELNRKCVKNGEPYSHDYHFFSSDGTEFNGTISGEPEYNQAGEIIGIAGVIRDLSDQAGIRIQNDMFLRAAKLGSIRIYDTIGVLQLSAAAATLIGEENKPLQITAKDWRKRIHPDDRKQASNNYKESIKQKTSAIRSYRIKHKNGHWLWVEIRSAAIFDENGEVAINYATIMDIDNRVRSKQLLVENEQRFRSALSQSREVIYELNAKGYFTYISDSGPKLFGYTNDELLTLRAYDLLANPPISYQQWIKDRSSQTQNEGVYLLTHKNGQQLNIHFNSVVVRNEEGVVTGFIGAARDISEQLTTQNKLQSNAKRLKEIVSTAQGWIFDLDENGCFTYSENHMSSFKSSKLEIEHLRGKPTYTMAPALGERHQEWLSMIQNSTDGIASEIALTDPETGDNIWARVHCVARYDKNGHCFGYRGVGFDITAQKQAESEIIRAKEAAEASAEERARFLSTMSHEIRTPLNAVIGMTDLLLDSPLDQKQNKLTKTANMAGKHLLCLINDILDHAKLDAGKVVLEEIAFNPQQEIRNVFDILSANAKEKQLSLNSDLDQNLNASYIGDPARFRQVLLNLVGNAIKFTKSGSVNVITKQISEQKIRIEVIDTGPGIAKDAQKKLFQDFSQADASTTRKHGGTGLGLAICKRLINIMGGEIGLVSKVDKGSTFWFEIPLKQTPESAQEKPTEPSSDTETQFKVLVAEDNPANQLLIRTVLEKLNQSVTIVENGKLVIEAIKSESFDLIFMDIQMPEMDGLTASKALRTAGNSIPIIALTANCVKAEKDRFLQAGMNDWLTKPFNIKDIITKLIQWGDYSQQAKSEIPTKQNANNS